jgi:hypothetical protein
MDSLEPEYRTDTTLRFRDRTENINSGIFASKSSRYAALNLAVAHFTIVDRKLRECSEESFSLWVAACHDRPCHPKEEHIEHLLLFCKFWGTPELAITICKKLSDTLAFNGLLKMLLCALKLDMPSDPMEDRIRLDVGKHLSDGTLTNIPVAVLVRLLDVPWKDDEIEPLLDFLIGKWRALGADSAPLFFTLESVELTRGQFERLKAEGVDLLFSPLVRGNDLFKQKRFVEDARQDIEKLKRRLRA